MTHTTSGPPVRDLVFDFDRNLISRIELSTIETIVTLWIAFFTTFQLFFNCKFLTKEFMVLWLPMHPRARSFRGFCYSSIGFSIHRPLWMECLYNTEFWSRTDSNTFICNSEFHASHEAIIRQLTTITVTFKDMQIRKQGPMPTNVTYQDVIGRQKRWTIGGTLY